MSELFVHSRVSPHLQRQLLAQPKSVETMVAPADKIKKEHNNL